MIFAVIADIHGNLPAFDAVLQDAQTKGAAAFLLLGDYIRDTPLVNEVIDRIRQLPNCTAILGNGDIGVISLHQTESTACEYDQMLPNFWAYKNLSQTNLDFLLSLPETAALLSTDGKLLHLAHSIPLIGHSPRLSAFHSGDYARKMEQAPFPFEAGIDAMQRTATEHAHEVAAYPGDICLFGHNHLQFLGETAGKILLNPGSCGLPADYDTRAPYALIRDEGDRLEIELHRVSYDINDVVEIIREFNAFAYADFWGKLRIALLQSGSDIVMSRFWEHARQMGGGNFPLENELWRKTVATFALP